MPELIVPKTAAAAAIFNAAACHLCGEANACARPDKNAVCDAAGLNCWCKEVVIPASVIEQIPAHLRGRACICQRCSKTI